MTEITMLEINRETDPLRKAALVHHRFGGCKNQRWLEVCNRLTHSVPLNDDPEWRDHFNYWDAWNAREDAFWHAVERIEQEYGPARSPKHLARPPHRERAA